MARNIEVKARLRSLAEAQAIALELTGKPPVVEEQVDTYFVVPHGRLKLREINGVRAQLVQYHRSDSASVRGSDYVLTSIDDPASLKRSLSAALGVRLAVHKRREIYLHENVRIHLDQVANLGDFIEFEAVLGPNITDAQGQQQVDQLLELFGIGVGDLLAHSYSDLLAERIS